MNTINVAETNARNTWLKLLAIVAMIFDHAIYGWIIHHNLHTEYWQGWRSPGRICIPIFSYLIAWNMAHNTHNPNRYATRLAIMAIISEPIYWLYFGYNGNAFIPLAAGAIAIIAIQNHNIWQLALTALLTAAIANACQDATIIAQTALTATAYLWITTHRPAALLASVALMPALNGLCIPFTLMIPITIALIAWAMHGTPTRPIKMNKTLFYAFYPLHLLALLLLWGPA